MKHTHIVLLALLLPIVACSASPTESVGRTSAAVVSATTTYLLPVDDGVREACRSTWAGQYCAAGDAVAAGEACVSAYLKTGASAPCAGTSKGCFQILTANTGCTADQPIYSVPALCDAPVERTCAFYSACLEAEQPCGESGYAIGYGEKYCGRFDVDMTFSAEGQIWRNNVLHCLQEALVTILPKAPTMTCDAITDFAFDSHPACYTGSPSFCFLPPSDIANVLSTIDGKDLLSLRSIDQMESVAEICVEQISGAIFSALDTTPGHKLSPLVPAHLADAAALTEQLKIWQEIEARNRK